MPCTYNSLGQVLTVDGPRTDVNDVTTYTIKPTARPMSTPCLKAGAALAAVLAVAASP